MSQSTVMFMSGKVPEERDAAHRLVAETQFYEIDNGVLYHLYFPRTKGHRHFMGLLQKKRMQ